MRGFKKRLSIGNKEPEIISRSSAQLSSPVYRNFRLSRQALLIIPVLAVIIVSGYVFYLFKNNNDNDSSKGDSTAVANIAAKSGLKSEQLSEPGSLTDEQKVSFSKAKVDYWKEKGDCKNQDFNTMLLAEDFVSQDKKADAINALEATIKDCPGANESVAYLKTLKDGN